LLCHSLHISRHVDFRAIPQTLLLATEFAYFPWENTELSIFALFITDFRYLFSVMYSSLTWHRYHSTLTALIAVIILQQSSVDGKPEADLQDVEHDAALAAS